MLPKDANCRGDQRRIGGCVRHEPLPCAGTAAYDQTFAFGMDKRDGGRVGGDAEFQGQRANAGNGGAGMQISVRHGILQPLLHASAR